MENLIKMVEIFKNMAIWVLIFTVGLTVACSEPQESSSKIIKADTNGMPVDSMALDSTTLEGNFDDDSFE